VFAEQSVVEVAPPLGRTFHPKIWVLRFTNAADSITHRLLCLSRNLTGDRSWDTVLVADESTAGEHRMAAAPASRFLEDLLTMSVRPVPERSGDCSVDEQRELLQAHEGLRRRAPSTRG
jgi:hypothetical protein